MSLLKNIEKLSQVDQNHDYSWFDRKRAQEDLTTPKWDKNNFNSTHWQYHVDQQYKKGWHQLDLLSKIFIYLIANKTAHELSDNLQK